MRGHVRNDRQRLLALDAVEQFLERHGIASQYALKPRSRNLSVVTVLAKQLFQDVRDGALFGPPLRIACLPRLPWGHQPVFLSHGVLTVNITV